MFGSDICQLDAKIVKVETGLNAKIDRVEANLDARMDKVEKKVDALGAKMVYACITMISAFIAIAKFFSNP
jgi:hypothetical protein